MKKEELLQKLRELQRYDMCVDGELYVNIYPEEDKNGDWVKFEDIKNIISQINGNQL